MSEACFAAAGQLAHKAAFTAVKVLSDYLVLTPYPVTSASLLDPVGVHLADSIAQQLTRSREIRSVC